MSLRMFAVGNLSCDCLHDDVVGQVIEETLDVGIENDSIACFVGLQHLRQRLMAVASGPEAEGRVVKQQFKDRMKQSTKRLLRHPVTNCGDTQRAELARLLGKVLPS